MTFEFIHATVMTIVIWVVFISWLKSTFQVPMTKLEGVLVGSAALALWIGYLLISHFVMFNLERCPKEWLLYGSLIAWVTANIFYGIWKKYVKHVSRTVDDYLIWGAVIIIGGAAITMLWGIMALPRGG